MIVQKMLEKKSCASRRDCEILLARVLHKQREQIIAHPEMPVPPAAAARFCKLFARLQRGEPLPYLVGEQWFYGRPFRVNKNVLIPRPETELLIELAIKKIPTFNAPISILDIGAGSGCIAITLAKAYPHARIIATDASPAALRLARANARHAGVAGRISFLRGNLLAPVLRPPLSRLLIVANLPYLTTSEWHALLRSLKKYEPRLALDGGRDGLKYFRALFKQLQQLSTLNSRLSTLLEIDPRRKRALGALAKKMLPKWEPTWHRDLAGRWRILELQRSDNLHPRRSRT